MSREELIIVADNDVRDDIVEFLQERGHAVHRVRDTLGEDATDDQVAHLTNDLRAILITGNHRHLKVRITRKPEYNHQRYRHASRISLTCRQPLGPVRLRYFIDLLEAEYEQQQHRGDRRLIAEIADDYAKIER